MLCIIEGPDRVGKTTLARGLQTKFKNEGRQCEIFKRAERSSNPMQAIIKDVFPLVHDRTIWIADRMHITEMVFSVYHKRKLLYSPEQLLWIDTCFGLAFDAAVLISLTAPTDILKQRYIETGEEIEFDLEIVSKMFIEACSSSSMLHATFDSYELDETDLLVAAYEAINPIVKIFMKESSYEF